MQAAASWPGPQLALGLSPSSDLGSVSAEDAVNVLNDGQDSEENFSVPSCYGGIGAPVGRQGESRGPKGSGFPAAGEGPRGERPRGACAYSPTCWIWDSCSHFWLTMAMVLPPETHPGPGLA